MRHLGSGRAGFEYASKGNPLSDRRNVSWRNEYLRDRVAALATQDTFPSAACRSGSLIPRRVWTLRPSDGVDRNDFAISEFFILGRFFCFLLSHEGAQCIGVICEGLSFPLELPGHIQRHPQFRIRWPAGRSLRGGRANHRWRHNSRSRI